MVTIGLKKPKYIDSFITILEDTTFVIVEQVLVIIVLLKLLIIPLD